MKFPLKFLMALLCLLLACVQELPAASDEWELWKKGFETYEKGEEDYLAGNKKDALAKFKTALEFFSQVKKTKPNWNKKVIDYRIDLCNRKIESISKALELEKEAPKTASPAAQPAVNQKTAKSNIPETAPDAKTADLKKELEKYKEKLFEATVMIENNKRELEKSKKASEEVNSLLKDKLELEKQCSALTLKYEELKNRATQPSTEAMELKQKLIGEKTASDKMKQELEKLSAENETLKNQKQELLKNKTVSAYEMKTLSDKNAEIMSENKKLAAKLSDAAKASETNEAKAQALEKQKEELRLRCEKKNQEYDLLYKELKAVRGKADAGAVSRQIEKENELFKKNIDSLQAKFDKLSDENSKLKTQFNQKSSEFASLNETLAAITKNKETLEQDLKVFTAKYEKSDITIKNQKQYIGELEERNKKLNDELKLFAGKNEKLESKIKSASAGKKPDGQPKENELNKKISELSEANKQLEEKLKTLAPAKNAEAKNQELARKIIELGELNRKLEDEVKALVPLKELSAKNLELTAQYQENAKKLSALTEANKQLEEKLKALAPLKDSSAKNAELTAENQGLSKKVSGLSEENKQLAEKLKIISETRDSSPKLAKLNTKNQELAKTIAELSELNKQLEEKIKNQNAPLETQLMALAQENAALKKELAVSKAKPANIAGENPSQGESEKKSVLGSLKKQAGEINNKLSEYKKQFDGTAQASPEAREDDKEKKQGSTPPASAENKKEQKDKPAPSAAPGKNASGESEKLNDKNKKSVNDGTISFLMNNAEKAEKEKDTQSALWHYNKVLKFAPENYEANKRLGLLHLKGNESVRALPFLEKAYRMNDGDVEVMLALASVNIGDKKYKEALEILNKAVILAPQNAVLHRYMGLVCRHTGKNELAEKEFRKSLELDPKSPETALCVALYLGSFKEKMNEAREWYEKALKLGALPTPESQKIFGSDVSSQNPSAKKKATIDEFRKKDEKAPKDGIDQISGKIKDMDKAGVDGETVRYLLESAEKHENENDLRTAVWELDKANSLSPNNAEILKRLGILLIKVYSEGKALTVLEEAHKLKSDDVEIILSLASLYMKNGKYTQALNILNMAVMLDPKNALVQRYMGITCKSLGNKDGADKSFRKSMELDPSSADTALEMALFLAFSCHKNEEAREWYVKAKQLGAKPNQLLERLK